MLPLKEIEKILIQNMEATLGHLQDALGYFPKTWIWCLEMSKMWFSAKKWRIQKNPEKSKKSILSVIYAKIEKKFSDFISLV